MRPWHFVGGFLLGAAAGAGAMWPSLHRARAAAQPAPSVSALEPKTRSAPSPTNVVVERSEAIASVDPMAEKTPAAMSAAFAKIVALGESPSRERQLDKFFQEWVIRDAIAAANFAREIEDDDLRKGALIRVMQTWAVQDAPAALAWAKDTAFASPNDREMAMSTACTWVSYSDPREALHYALDYNVEGNPKGMLLQSLTERWAERDVATVRDWVAQQPPGPQREKFIAGVARALVQTDPAEAARYVLDQIPPGENQNTAALAVLCQWALKDLEGASAWVQRFPPGPLRDQAMDQLAATLEH